jgi:hypothetical protein
LAFSSPVRDLKKAAAIPGRIFWNVQRKQKRMRWCFLDIARALRGAAGHSGRSRVRGAK